MAIDKAAFEAAVKKVRRVYKEHTNGSISAREFSSRASRLFRELNYLHEHALIVETVERVKVEVTSYQKQFDLKLKLEHHIHYNRKGICRVQVNLSCQRLFAPHQYVFLSIFIGPVTSWDTIAVHTTKELADWPLTSLYRKAYRKRWQSIETFDFAHILERIHDMVHAPYIPHEDEDDIPF